MKIAIAKKKPLEEGVEVNPEVKNLEAGLKAAIK
jgi:hypothetical protein